MKIQIESMENDMLSPMVTLNNDGLIVRQIQMHLNENMYEMRFEMQGVDEKEAIVKLYKYLHQKIFN